MACTYLICMYLARMKLSRLVFILVNCKLFLSGDGNVTNIDMNVDVGCTWTLLLKVFCSSSCFLFVAK